MPTSKRLTRDGAPFLKKGELAAMVESGSARVVRNRGNMVKVLRAKLNMSQSEFARAFRLSLRTVQEWEQGRHKPDQIAKNYLEIIREKPRFVQKILKSA